ncbi:hypothetical protein D7V86_25850 [bacterium D16-51]|nr:hypothetical protein D7V96_09945 [bacterium D16-59]RKI52526.1 hypothetical protein D7V86_25850 [bacterium D16-51]
MNQYQFEQIAKRMERRYGKIRKGEEEKHSMLLFPMESNLLKIHRKYPDANSRRLEEAILLALHEVEMHITGEQIDVRCFEGQENIRLKNALMQAFDPFTNREICDVLEHMEKIDFHDKKELENYYKEPVLCILRIQESVKTMLKRNGADGYFDFLERTIGTLITNNEEMNYSIYSDSNQPYMQ